MLKRIKLIQKVGIYRDFSWSDTSSFKKYNAFYGFNASGKSTLARIFQALDGTKLEYRETGSSVVFEDSDSNQIEVKDEIKTFSVLTYDEEFINSNLKWDLGVKSFVVIGKKSKEDEEKLKTLSDKKSEILIAKKIAEAEIKHLTELLNEVASAIAAEMKRELVQFNATKYVNYNKKLLENDVKNFKSDEFENMDRLKIQDLKNKIDQFKLDEIPLQTGILNKSHLEVFDSAFSFLERALPTKTDVDYLESEISWLEQGLHLHKEKQICLLCEGILSEERKVHVRMNITSEVASYIKEGKSISGNLSTMNLLAQKISVKSIYPEIRSRFDDLIESERKLIESLNESTNDLSSDIDGRVEFSEQPLKSNSINIREKIEHAKVVSSDLEKLIKENNQIGQNLDSQKKISLKHIEAIFFNDYQGKTKTLRGKLASAHSSHENQEKQLRALNEQIMGIEMSLQSEAKAIIGINTMLSIFLGRSDISLEYKEDQKRFEILRKNQPAKRLSEGEKTAIAVCYFLILVNANPDLKKDMIVVIDDPISSLDTNNLYNAYAVLKENLKDVKQLFILTHNLYFFRLVYKWFKDFEADSSYFRVETTINQGKVSSGIRGLQKVAKETSTEYILLYSHLKNFIARSESQTLTDIDFLPYPNMLRRLIEAYLYTKHPGKRNSEFEEDLISLGVRAEVARKADRFCNDFSHARFDSIFGQEGNSISQAPEIVKSLLDELEKIDPTHFESMKGFISP